ncbi:unnamed protein product [Laminaria digitata]
MLEVVQDDHEFELAATARVDVLVSAIEPRQASQVVKDLSALLPLDEAKLNHLKRIRSSQQPGVGRLLQVLLAPPDMYYSLEEPKRMMIEERYSFKPTSYAVPKLEPRTRQQFENGQSAWPMIFHHSTSEEARRAARAIPEQEAIDAVAFMREALKDADAGRRQAAGRATVGAVLVDPAAGKVVASSSLERQKVHDDWPPSMRDHPLHHAAMLCVQGVGLALAAAKKEASREEGTVEGKLPPEGEGKGEGDAGAAASDASADPGGWRGTRPEPAVGGQVLSSKQYLCTGYDLYTTREPCLMCAMALVHSRVRRVVYGVRDPERGCLGSLMMLHTLPSLNHNYRAFEGVCADDCRQSLLACQDSKPAV